MPTHHDLANRAFQPTASGEPPVCAIQAPHLLILLLLSRCNNRCRFCMVDDEIEVSDDMQLEVAQQLIEDQCPGTRIEFFGGEPTIYPHFWELLTLARERGHSCSIATNGRTFASERFVARMSALGASEIYVRTSLYGPDAETHDYYTRSKKSYDQTVRGLEHIVSRGFPCQVNVVVMRRNLQHLSRMVELVAGLGVPRIKFGMLIDGAKNQDHLVRLAALREPLRAALEDARQMGLRTTIEKAPFCAAPRCVSHFACEGQVAPMDRAYAWDGPCGQCIVARWCPGVDPFYLQHFGPGELVPIQSVPLDQVHVMSPDLLGSLDPEIFRIHFLALDLAWMEDEVFLTELARLKSRIAENLGEMALVPLARVCRE